MGAALKPLADASTLLLTYAQVISSLLVALPRVEWPEPFASIARVLGVFALDLTPLFSLDAVGEGVVRVRVSPNPKPNPKPKPKPNPNQVGEGVGDAMHAAAVTVLLSAEPSP